MCCVWLCCCFCTRSPQNDIAAARRRRRRRCIYRRLRLRTVRTIVVPSDTSKPSCCSPHQRTTAAVAVRHTRSFPVRSSRSRMCRSVPVPFAIAPRLYIFQTRPRILSNAPARTVFLSADCLCPSRVHYFIFFTSKIANDLCNFVENNLLPESGIRVLSTLNSAKTIATIVRRFCATTTTTTTSQC